MRIMNVGDHENDGTMKLRLERIGLEIEMTFGRSGHSASEGCWKYETGIERRG